MSFHLYLYLQAISAINYNFTNWGKNSPSQHAFGKRYFISVVPWTARRSNESILKEINSEYSLEGLMLKLKLKLQSFGHLMWSANSLEKSLTLGKAEGRRRRDDRG